MKVVFGQTAGAEDATVGVESATAGVESVTAGVVAGVVAAWINARRGRRQRSNTFSVPIDALAL
ncbi:ABC-type uncharacterized transport system permease subunit [Streptomyces aurantiacus]|nr:ABC-type uncharacterized transport system permease subunit [Streptomyces aurantiacus]